MNTKNKQKIETDDADAKQAKGIFCVKNLTTNSCTKTDVFIILINIQFPSF